MSHEAIDQPNRNGQQAADVMVVPKAERRRFGAEYKLRILAEADSCTQRGAIGAVLMVQGRDEGVTTLLDHSHSEPPVTWRQR
jgi:hypothetical protein